MNEALWCEERWQDKERQEVCAQVMREEGERLPRQWGEEMRLVKEQRAERTGGGGGAAVAPGRSACPPRRSGSRRRARGGGVGA